MDDIKKYIMYALLIIAFWIFSNFLIYVGINSTYKTIQRQDDTSQINVYQAEATVANGRIRGVVTNEGVENISGKYIKLELFSERGIEVGTRYIPIGELRTKEAKALEYNFKVSHVKSYKFSIVNEKGPEEEINTDIKMTMPQILLATAVVMLILW